MRVNRTSFTRARGEFAVWRLQIEADEHKTWRESPGFCIWLERAI
jgi:hypothetical protein